MGLNTPLMTDEPDINRRLDTLEETLADLRAELATEEGRNREMASDSFLQLAWDIAVPIGIAVIEVQLRTLKRLSENLQQFDRERGQRSLDNWTRETRRQGVTTLSRLEDTLEQLEQDIDRGRIPAGGNIRELLSETRELTQDIEQQVQSVDATASDEEPTSRDRGVQIDVESELDTIRDELDDENESNNQDE